MKYAILFTLLVVALVLYAVQNGGVTYCLLWPALTLAIVATGYASQNAAVFGKRADGTIGFRHALFLFPYLVYAWLVWHLIRLFSREPSSHELTPGLRIGRRLLPAELNRDVTLIVDLTCEFIEPKQNRARCEYWSFPVLDGLIPTESQARKWASAIANYDGIVFIHCAQGHGRTGTLAALVLIANGTAKDADEAIELLQKARPVLRLNALQTEFVNRVSVDIDNRGLQH